MPPSSFEHSDGMRSAQVNVLEDLGKKYKVIEWIDASERFRGSGNLIIELCKTVVKQDYQKCPKFVTQIADIEEKAFQLLEDA